MMERVLFGSYRCRGDKGALEFSPSMFSCE